MPGSASGQQWAARSSMHVLKGRLDNSKQGGLWAVWLQAVRATGRKCGRVAGKRCRRHPAQASCGYPEPVN